MHPRHRDGQSGNAVRARDRLEEGGGVCDGGVFAGGDGGVEGIVGGEGGRDEGAGEVFVGEVFSEFGEDCGDDVGCGTGSGVSTLDEDIR